MTLSIVIPTYTINEALKNMTLRCFNSLNDYDELLICENGGLLPHVDIYEKADFYIRSKTNRGFTKNVNMGFQNAHSDFIAVVSNDTYVISGKLKDLCIPGKVTSPHIENQHIDGMAGSFFVVPRDILNQRGLLDESMHTYYSDEDYKQRTADIFLKVPSVVIHHDQAQTVTAAGENNPDQSERDRIAYENLSNRR